MRTGDSTLLYIYIPRTFVLSDVTGVMDTCDRHRGRSPCEYALYCNLFVHCAVRLVPPDRLTRDRRLHLSTLLFLVGPTVVFYTSVLLITPSDLCWKTAADEFETSVATAATAATFAKSGKC